MVTTESTTPAQKRTELRKAVIELREHGLVESAKWAAELMAGELICLHRLTALATQHLELRDAEACLFEGLPQPKEQPIHQFGSKRSKVADACVPSTCGSEAEDDLYLLAKSVFDMKVRTFLPASSYQGCLLSVLRLMISST